MGKNKLRKFSDLNEFPNVYQNFSQKDKVVYDSNGSEVNLKGKWNTDHFKNDHPITLELACGGGEYTVGLAQRYPNRNFIGIDIKGARIWKGAKQSLDEGLTNAAFLRTRIELLPYFFEEKEINEIWITFPDPFMKKANRRLTAGVFLLMYQKLMKTDGLIHLKTDSAELYEFTQRMMVEYDCKVEYHHDDIYSGDLYTPELEIKTYYEKMHLEKGKKITYTRFQLPQTPIVPKRHKR